MTDDEKDAEISRLRALLAAAAERTSTKSSNTEEWVHLETRLPIQPTEETEQKEVTQPYEVVLHGQGSLGFQLSRAFVAVRRSVQTAAAEGRLSKLYALSGAGTNAAMASPYVLQERAVVLKVEGKTQKPKCIEYIEHTRNQEGGPCSAEFKWAMAALPCALYRSNARRQSPPPPEGGVRIVCCMR